MNELIFSIEKISSGWFYVSFALQEQKSASVRRMRGKSR